MLPSVHRFRRDFSILLVVSSFFFFQACETKSENQESSILALVAISQASAVPALPSPAIDTALLKIGDQEPTTLPVGFCEDGNTGIGFFQGGANPTLFVHEVDFNQSGAIVLNRTGAYHMDVDVTGGYYSPTSTCQATVRESSATAYEIEAYNCPVHPMIGTMPDTTISFRARCTKN
ncbi:hypothetical protein EHQ12_09445 [Leptospira gomenensis]|uniref:Lipoprotein n=1 Tax=Leptospira gomenensis TaxID=2484974 RepID=A0A5F1YF45_9LEPT|nr:hypothetical protein [Leptospira gomenensis]TGK38352.1 hypothetical protein EHQ17_01510 [Leptospira gomenensis]TGK39272.1 hypothetical protein EHQ12_09445 [Leptospira gomenensis]TGK52166.1 hypothetical protein EHQ07_00935 [Leptospira gomenensis]TGK62980.1 hypothetical protein EHQ13_08050 [Leptospira gomenensis]